MIGWAKPEVPKGSLPVVMSVLGAVVMPHNLFLHSEIIQSRKWNLKDKNVIEQQLKYEFKDTLFSMIIGWAINSAMILMAAATLYQENGHSIDYVNTTSRKCSIHYICTGIIIGWNLIKYHSWNGWRNYFFWNF